MVSTLLKFVLYFVIVTLHLTDCLSMGILFKFHTKSVGLGNYR